jgi:DNA-binding response OmpR family regulator
VSQRVLVVDDFDEIRILIRRVLTAGGYDVDVAASLAQARDLNPATYDAVLVDARLGPERGMDLVDELLSADPAAAGRCLVITGAAADTLPPDVACLAKPFKPDQLLAAVRGLLGPAGSAPARRPPDDNAAAAARAEAPIADESRPEARPPPGWRLLDLTRRLRAHEHAQLTDFLHDGPVQELTAAVIELQLMRRSAAPGHATALEAVTHRLDAATRSLRWLMDDEGPVLPSGADLPALLRQRAARILATPLAVEAGPPAGPSAADAAAIADVVELMLLAVVPADPPVRAHVAVRAQRSPHQVVLTVTPVTDGDVLGDPFAIRPALDGLAAALQASVRWERPGPGWRVTLLWAVQARQ